MRAPRIFATGTIFGETTMIHLDLGVTCGPARGAALAAAMRATQARPQPIHQRDLGVEDGQLDPHFRISWQDPRAVRDTLARFLGSSSLHLSPQLKTPLRIGAAALNTVRLLTLEHEGDLVFEAPGHPSSYIVMIPLSGGTRHRLEQQVLYAQPGSALVRNPGSHIHVAANGPFRILLMRLDGAVLAARLARLLHRPLKSTLSFALHIDLTKEGRSLWNTLSWICREIDNSDNIFRRSAIVAGEAETLLINTLLTLQQNTYSEDLRAVSSVAVPRHLKAVLSAIDATPQSIWSLSEMARTGGVSVRTLCDAFRNFRGCTPMEFVRSVRLSRARDDLRRLGHGVPVADIARRWGFGHPGRFAAIYRSTYGQTPSQTLRFGVGQDAD